MVMAADKHRGRHTLVASAAAAAAGEGEAIVPPGAVLLAAPAVAAVVAGEALDRCCHFCLRAPPARGGTILECVRWIGGGGGWGGGGHECDICTNNWEIHIQLINQSTNQSTNQINPAHQYHHTPPPPLPQQQQLQTRCEVCRTAHWCSRACFEAEAETHGLLCPRLRRVRQRGLLKGLGTTPHALDGDVIRLTLQVRVGAWMGFFQMWGESID